jgi:diguanylate cyclase (GGDEF)-like protein
MRDALKRLTNALARHSVPIIDGAFLVVFTAAALYYCYEVQVFPSGRGESGNAHSIELSEALLVATMFCAGLCFFVIRRLAEQRRETARRIEAEKAIRVLAFHDTLTGLPNRRRFDDALTAAVGSLPRTGASHGVLALDLNGFKRVNDLFGHAVGDELLIAVSGRLAECVREGDIVSRLGGDEFAILSLNIGGAEAALGLALRIIDSLADAVAPVGASTRSARRLASHSYRRTEAIRASFCAKPIWRSTVPKPKPAQLYAFMKRKWDDKFGKEPRSNKSSALRSTTTRSNRFTSP